MNEACNGGIFKLGEPNVGYAQYFKGNSYLNPLVYDQVSISNVTFEPGCRNNWHIHYVANQILLCTAGEGWYQEWDKAAVHLKAGDYVVIPVGVKHWHGALKDKWFTHLAITPIKDGAKTEWLEPVEETTYQQLSY